MTSQPKPWWPLPSLPASLILFPVTPSATSKALAGQTAQAVLPEGMSHKEILPRKGMTVDAMGLSCVHSRRRTPPQVVLLHSDRLKVRRVHARPNPAEMVESLPKPVRVGYQQAENHSVGQAVVSFPPDAAISASASACHPNPTPALGDKNLLPDTLRQGGELRLPLWLLSHSANSSGSPSLWVGGSLSFTLGESK